MIDLTENIVDQLIWRLRLDDNGDDGEITLDEEGIDNDSDDEDDLRQARYDDNH